MRSAFLRFAAVLLASSILISVGTIAVRARTGGGAAATKDGRLQRVEATAVELPGADGEAPLRLSLAELMKTYNDPGLSIAVIED